MSTLYSILFMSVLFFMTYSMFYMNSPLSLAAVCMLTICFSVIYFFFKNSDFMSYMLFLVYIGGLLVLLIYMIMVSMNYIVDYTMSLSLSGFILLFVGGLLINLYGHESLLFKDMESGSTMVFMVSGLGLLGALLLYVFLYICNSVVVGGRTLNFGT